MRRYRSNRRVPDHGTAVHLVMLGVLLLFNLICLAGLIGGADGSFDVGSVRPGVLEKFMRGAFVAASALGLLIGVACFLAISVRLVQRWRSGRKKGPGGVAPGPFLASDPEA